MAEKRVRLRRTRTADERARKLRAVLDVLPVGVFIADAQGRITEYNRCVLDIWGREPPKPGEPAGYGVYRGWWPDSGRPVEPAEWGLARAIARGEASGPEEVRVETFDGASKTLLNYAAPIRDADERVVGAVAVNVDITARKRGEERERLLGGLGARLVGSAPDGDAMMRIVAEAMVPAIADLGAACIRDPETREVRHLAVACRDRTREPRVGDLVRRIANSAPEPVRDLLDRREPLVVPQVSEAHLRALAADDEQLAALRSLGLRSLLFVPIAAADRPLGALVFASAGSGRIYDAGDLAVVRPLAQRVALAMESAWLFDETERHVREERALGRALADVVGAYSTGGVIQAIAEAALEATGADAAFVERLDAGARDLEVVAVAGHGTPAIGRRVPLHGSYAERVIQSRQPALISDIERASGPLPAGLPHACAHCMAIALPLVDAGEPIGALFVLREASRVPFRADEIDRAHDFAALASLAFRKVRLLEDAERRRQDLEAVSESRARLVRGFSHDVRNPLGSADVYLQALEAGAFGELPPGHAEHIARVRAHLQRAAELIDDVVAVARADAEHVTIEPRPTDVRFVVRDVVEEYRVRAQQKGLALTVRLPDAIALIESDPTRIRQVLENVLSNAVKYTERGRVEVSVQEQGGPRAPGPGRWIAVDVADTGPGIPPGARKLVFQEFMRLSPGPRPGAGIGLAIALRLAEALGGALTLESEVGRGSTFTLWLPIAEP
jgi:signal transduction histidine kinase